ncbi:MAG: dihydrodipicolinate synthase family protein [Planctomycetes bacterium]|nr:dihydrodipicolinate synthase family protein [Planctomycetota bacterium]MCP4770881.1 dihydrodipicolinate synthase family protein [Planctomycetota bacterium]MCP4862294.1 dihydrodipicolinate synthase family protein [Planctomycetota bacterium]
MNLDHFQSKLAQLDAAAKVPSSRIAYAAAHIVVHDEAGTQLDLEATDQQRVFLDQQGFGIAEAMDTAQRFELGWDVARTLIERTARLGLTHGFAAGVSADHVAPVESLGELATAVAWQVDFVRECGGLPVILPMPQLAHVGASADEYVSVYRDILDQSSGPVLLHWLGPMFLPGLDAYFPEDSFERIMGLDHERIIGIKLSLLDAEREKSICTALAPHGQHVYTGDDFNFAALIAGNGATPGVTEKRGEFSHALLGIFDAIARPAGIALRLLAHGQVDDYMQLMLPCEELSRVIFEHPTRHYKAGLAYLSWLDERQQNPWLPQQTHLQRSADHYAQILDLAFKARVFSDPAAARSRAEAGPPSC